MDNLDSLRVQSEFCPLGGAFIVSPRTYPIGQNKITITLSLKLHLNSWLSVVGKNKLQRRATEIKQVDAFSYSNLAYGEPCLYYFCFPA